MRPRFVPYDPDDRGLSAPPAKRVGAPKPGALKQSWTQPGTATIPAVPQAASPFRPGVRPGPPVTGIYPPQRMPDRAVLSPSVVGPAGAVVALLGFYIFLHTSLGGEVLKIFLHIPFPVVAIFAVIVPLVAFITGKPFVFFGTPLARPWLLLLAWILFSAVLSFYPRESVTEAIPYALRFQIMPFVFCAVATTSKSVRTLLVAAALGILPVLLLCFTKGEMEEGTRFGVAHTSLENPNDLAFLLLWGSTLLVLFLLGKGKLGKVVALVAIPSCFWFILKTASRANFLTIFAVLGVALLIAAPSVRIILLFAVPMGLAITLPLLPKATLDRILSVAVSSSIDEVGKQSSAAATGQLAGALASEAARMELAKLAVDATLRHPVFGVGMAMFANETADFVLRATGQKAPWLTAHNSYLKISSENGIPGLIFYVWSIAAAIGMTWRTFNKSRGRPGFQDANQNSVCILLALVVYAVGTFFCDVVYLPYLSITVGLASANFLAFRNEDRLAAASVPLPQPAYGRVRAR